MGRVRDVARFTVFFAHQPSVRPPVRPSSAALPAGVLAENNRLPQSKEIIAAFEEIMAATRSEVACKVVSAQVGTY